MTNEYLNYKHRTILHAGNGQHQTGDVMWEMDAIEYDIESTISDDLM